MRRFGAEPSGKLLFRIAVAPAQEIDDVERADIAEQFAAAVGLGALQRLLEQGERLEASSNVFRAIDDFADADDDGNTVFGGGYLGISSCFTFELLIDASVIASFVGWAKARERRAHHPPPRTRLVGTLRFAHPTMATCVASLRHQRVHVLDGLRKIFLELLHHGAG